MAFYYVVIQTLQFTKTGVASAYHTTTGLIDKHPISYINNQNQINDELKGKRQLFADIKLLSWQKVSEEEYKLYKDTNSILIYSEVNK